MYPSPRLIDLLLFDIKRLLSLFVMVQIYCMALDAAILKVWLRSVIWVYKKLDHNIVIFSNRD